MRCRRRVLDERRRGVRVHDVCYRMGDRAGSQSEDLSIRGEMDVAGKRAA
jgi:hypothetical protein